MNPALKIPIIIVLFFIFTLLQAGFLAYFAIAGQMINLIFILFFVLIFFLKPDDYIQGFLISTAAGFFLDLLLPSYFGISIFILLLIFFIQEASLHFLRQGQDKYPFFYFASLFSACFILYGALMYVSSLLFHFSAHYGSDILIGLVYNLLFASVGFFIYKKSHQQELGDNQLKL